jgi:hypothetical protein
MVPFFDSSASQRRLSLPSAEKTRELADRVEEVFLRALAEKENSLTRTTPPTEDMLREARNTALACLPESVAALVAESFSVTSDKEHSFTPFFADEIPSGRLAAIAAVGSLGGMLLLEPLATYLLHIPKMGLFLGAPLGAWLLPKLCLFLGENSPLRRGLLAALGLATLADLTEFGPTTLVKRLFGVPSGGGKTRRLFLYGSVFLLLFLCRPRKVFRRHEAAAALKNSVRAALNAEERASQALLPSPTSPEKSPSLTALEVLARLAGPLEDLAIATQAPPEGAERDGTLRDAAAHLVQEAALAGYDLGNSFSKSNTASTQEIPLVWSDDLATRFETFGHILPGDPVRIELRPVLWNGQVLSKGLLRKRRVS